MKQWKRVVSAITRTTRWVNCSGVSARVRGIAGALDLLLRRGGEVEEELGWHDEEVGRDLVAGHAVFHFLDRLVKAEALLLHDRVHQHLVRHGRADRAARAEALGEIVAELQTRTEHTS
jgi:hypothetical protein